MDDLTEQVSPHYINSTPRKMYAEHLFVREALHRLPQMGVTDLEVLPSEIDAGGNDLMSYHHITGISSSRRRRPVARPVR